MSSETLFDPAALASFPAAPGVYIMKDHAGAVLYVGKAANLRNRVRNYFSRSGDNRFSVNFLRRHVTSIEFIVTSNEKEAFLLENTLIKKHKPRYNIQLRDDKTYISLRLRMEPEYPQLQTVRVRRMTDIPKSSRDLYFGPYVSVQAVREVMRFLLKIFPIRTCSDSVFRTRTRPCILYDVGKCCGPCVLPVSKEEYRKLVDKVVLFLQGRDDQIRDMLRERMKEFSREMEFEKAAMVRDRIAALDVMLEKQQAAVHARADRDVIAIASQQGRSLIVLQQYRGGAFTDSREFYLKNYDQDDAEVLYSFLSQHYAAATFVPREILVRTEPHDPELLEEWLRDQRGGPVKLSTPHRGQNARLTDAAETNARQLLERRLAGEHNQEEILEELAQKLDLTAIPRTIECVDISNIMGTLAVGSLVRFEEGNPDKSGYRLFKIRTVEGANDFAMIREVLRRRFRPESGKAKTPPDLLLIDGGKGQLSAAMIVFAEFGIRDVALASIAKSRLKIAGRGKHAGDSDAAEDQDGMTDEIREDGEASTRKTHNAGGKQVRYRTEERIFLPNRKNPVTFHSNSPALYLLQRARDEAHRFAITYHRKLRSKTSQRSLLDEIPGIGAKRKRILLRHFGSLSAIRQASLEELAAVEGISRDAAASVYQFFHQGQTTESRPEIVEEPVE